MNVAVSGTYATSKRVPLHSQKTTSCFVTDSKSVCVESDGCVEYSTLLYCSSRVAIVVGHENVWISSKPPKLRLDVVTCDRWEKIKSAEHTQCFSVLESFGGMAFVLPPNKNNTTELVRCSYSTNRTVACNKIKRTFLHISKRNNTKHTCHTFPTTKPSSSIGSSPPHFPCAVVLRRECTHTHTHTHRVEPMRTKRDHPGYAYVQNHFVALSLSLFLPREEWIVTWGKSLYHSQGAIFPL